MGRENHDLSPTTHDELVNEISALADIHRRSFIFFIHTHTYIYNI